MKQIPVTYETQFWNDFKNPPTVEFYGYGPTGIHIWIYYPHDNSKLLWTNWAGNINDIKNLKKRKALWCYQVSPLQPD